MFLKIEKIVPDKLTDKEWEELHKFSAQIFTELHPHLIAPTLDATRKSFSNVEESKASTHYIIRDGNKILAKSRVDYTKEYTDNLPESTLSWASIDIRVRADMRRNGIATFMLTDHMKNVILPRHKDIYIWAKLEPGRAFQENLGGTNVREIFTSHICFDNADWENITKLNKESLEKSGDITVNITEGISDDIEPEYMNLLADVTYELSKYVDSWEFDRELFIEENRKWMKKSTDQGFKRYIAWARNTDGKLIGFSELFYVPDVPGRLGTRMTGVVEEFRGKGLCKRMKTDLMFYVRDNLPEINVITTDNDKDNAAMRKINDQLGFVPDKPMVSYKYDVSELQGLLGL